MLYGSAPVAQAVAARTTATGGGVGLGLTARLLRRPIWLLGLLGEVAAFALEAFAFSAAPATLVAPVASCDLVVFVLLGTLVFGARWTAIGRTGALGMALGVALLAISLGGDDTLGNPATSIELWSLLGGCVLVVTAAAALGQRALRAGQGTFAAVAFSTGSGVAYGVATLATRQIGRTFDNAHPFALLATPTPYVLAACSLLAIVVMQRGLQASPLVTYPITSAVSAFLPVIVGVTVLSDVVPTGAPRIGFVAALLLLAGGVVLIARDRHAADDHVS